MTNLSDSLQLDIPSLRRFRKRGCSQKAALDEQKLLNFYNVKLPNRVDKVDGKHMKEVIACARVISRIVVIAILYCYK